MVCLFRLQNPSQKIDHAAEYWTDRRYQGSWALLYFSGCICNDVHLRSQYRIIVQSQSLRNTVHCLCWIYFRLKSIICFMPHPSFQCVACFWMISCLQSRISPWHDLGWCLKLSVLFCAMLFCCWWLPIVTYVHWLLEMRNKSFWCSFAFVVFIIHSDSVWGRIPFWVRVICAHRNYVWKINSSNGNVTCSGICGFCDESHEEHDSQGYSRWARKSVKDGMERGVCILLSSSIHIIYHSISGWFSRT